jgi:hypothetical protein
MEARKGVPKHIRVAPAAALCTFAMLLPVAAEAKEVLVKASACGASGCNVERSTAETQTLPFTLLEPAMESDRGTSAPPAGERFRIRLWTATGSNRTTRIVSDYFPSSGYLRVEGRHGRCGYRCMPIRARWVELRSEARLGSETEAYADLTEGLIPVPPAAPAETASHDAASPLLPVAAAIGLVGLIGAWRLKGA